MKCLRKKALASYVALSVVTSMLPVPVLAEAPVVDLNKVTSQITTSNQLVTIPYRGEGYQVSFEVASQWEKGFVGNIFLTNTGNEAIEDWALAFDFKGEISSIWQAELVSCSENHYVLKNMPQNQCINVGETIQITFEAVFQEDVSIPESYDLISQDAVVAHKEVMDVNLDTDGDGLLDWIETILGTNLTCQDTDGDGLRDDIEVCVIDTDPLQVDSDANGINDGEEDYDKDGLLNIKEIQFETKIYLEDTDHDGLKDGEEVNTYGTSPTSLDTDTDNLSDFEEITLGLDPLDTVSDGATPDGERLFYQVLSEHQFEPYLISEQNCVLPKIHGEVTGLIDINIVARVSDLREYATNDAVLGPVMEIKSRYTANDFILDYDVTQIIGVEGETYGKELLICKVKDEGLTPMETTYEAGHLSTIIHEGGHYLIINTNEFLKSLGIDVLSHVTTVPSATSEASTYSQYSRANFYALSTKHLNKAPVVKLPQSAEESNEIILDTYQVVTLDETVSDTDQDGLTDEEELGETKTVDVEWAVNQVLESRSTAEASTYTGDTTVEVTTYSTNPTLVDTDYDGINDNDARDLIKRSSGTKDANAFSGKLYVNYEDGVDVNFKVDYRSFFEDDNTSYHKDLSVLGALYAALAYHNQLTVDKGTQLSGDIQTIFEGFGLEDFKDYNLKHYYKDDDLSEVMLGHHLVSYNGEEKEIIIAAVRGTNGTIEEWSSNFDVGANTDNYWDQSNRYWRNKINHKGFDVAANRLYDYIVKYIAENVTSSADKTIYIIGHSRGAAIANILGQKFEDNKNYESYTYTFACPNTTTSNKANTYQTIYNVVNSDDIITELPLTSWGFTKYGTTKPISVERYYEDSNPIDDAEGTFEWLTGEDYNNDGGTARTLAAFEKVASSRAALYEYDTTSEGVVNPNNKYFLNRASAEKELAAVKADLIAQRLNQYATAYIEEGTFYKVLVRYKPAFLMQVLANMTIGVGPTLGYDVTGKYAKAKASFVASSGVLLIGGMAHPHFQETYYLIATNDFKKLT